MPADHELAHRLQKEHQQIRDLISELEKEANKNLLETLAKFIDDHIRFEEWELLGFLEQILSKDELDMISLRLKENPVTESEWKDEFWIKSN